MVKLTDAELIEELKKRFQDNERALHDLRVITKKLELLNAKLQESEALKSNFLSNIRNEINNPLASIMGLSRKLVMSHDDPRLVSTMGNLIYSESFDLDFQLRNIFTAAEVEAGECAPGVSRADLAALVRGVIESLSHRAESKNIRIDLLCECNAVGDALLFRTDPEKVHLILLNLLANAIEFSYEGKEVIVRARVEDGSLLISVEDFGQGFSQQDKGRIFDRFKQLDSGARKSHRGHGLGLSVTKALVDVLGGKIDFSSNEGKGCVFKISIPEAEAVTGLGVYSEESNEFIFEEEGREESF